MHYKKLLFVSTPVGPLGGGTGGGVELTLYNCLKALQKRGYFIDVVAPLGSKLEGISLHQIAGELEKSIQDQSPADPITVYNNSVLSNMWQYVREIEQDYDLIVNFSFDWLPLYLTPFLKKNVAHLISMGSLSNLIDTAIEKVLKHFPYTVAVHGKIQAQTFSFCDQLLCLGNGLDIDQYQFCAQPQDYLAWVGRISPEKGLEDAVAAAQMSNIPLRIFGLMQNRDYFDRICASYPNAPIEYGGFLSTAQLQDQLKFARALLMTPHWVEAFGNVAIEAMACGVPVIAYRRGGPTEIVQDGRTGYLVEPDDISAIVSAISRIDKIDRWLCREQAQLFYSLDSLGERLESWFNKI
jgi:UDP-glucose:tetrahydrobiopterin glucosyltransferase